MTQPRHAFVDWMKSLGLFLIVFGHVTAATDRLLPPIYPKQLGVAFFLFTTGFTLARESRPGRVVVFNRLFEVFLFGIACAAAVSAFNYARVSDLTESNYLPFLLGANVAFDHFPANPTTWFIGTFTHILLLWAILLRRVRIRPWMLAASLVVEVPARALLAKAAGPFVAYMAVPNWMTVFLLGLYSGQEFVAEPESGPARYLIALALLTAGWSALIGRIVGTHEFPFMTIDAGAPAADPFVASFLVSATYLIFTFIAYQWTRRLPEWRPARFFARNTVIVFIVHMPVFYLLRGPLAHRIDSRALRAAVQFGAGFLLLALGSELIHRALRPTTLRDRARRLLFNEPRTEAMPGARTAAAGPSLPRRAGAGARPDGTPGY